MAWWGKLIGGALGFVIGGPLGALLGASFGHNFDGKGGEGNPRIGSRRSSPGDQERTQAAFFTATFSIMGHVSKADGKVTQDEIELANSLMREMQLDAEQKKLARHLFNSGKEDDFDFDGVVDQFRLECHRRSTLLRIFLEIQVQAAYADNLLDPSENEILKILARRLGFSGGMLQDIINMVVGGSHAQQHGGKATLEDAYAILGVEASTPTAEIKRTYRRLMSQHHPDKLVSKGLPEEMIKLANEKTHEIQSAWKVVQEARAN